MDRIIDIKSELINYFESKGIAYIPNRVVSYRADELMTDFYIPDFNTYMLIVDKKYLMETYKDFKICGKIFNYNTIIIDESNFTYKKFLYEYLDKELS